MVPIEESKYQGFIDKLQRDNPVWANDPVEIRSRMAKLDQLILDVVIKYPDPVCFHKWAGAFFISRNCLARHIGDKEKEWADYTQEAIETQTMALVKK